MVFGGVELIGDMHLSVNVSDIVILGEDKWISLNMNNFGIWIDRDLIFFLNSGNFSRVIHWWYPWVCKWHQDRDIGAAQVNIFEYE